MSLQLQGAASTLRRRPFDFGGFLPFLAPLLGAAARFLLPTVVPLVTGFVQQKVQQVLAPAAPRFAAEEEEEFGEFEWSDEELEELLDELEFEEPAAAVALPVPAAPPLVRSLQPSIAFAAQPGQAATFAGRIMATRRELL